MAKIIFKSESVSENLVSNYKELIGMTVSKCGRQGFYFKAFEPGTRFDLKPANNEILIKLDERPNGYSNYSVTVTYHDEGECHFALFYKNSAGDVKKTELVDLKNSNEWKSHTFILEDLTPNSDYKGYDFGVSIYDAFTGIRKDGMTFGEIEVKKDEKTAPVKVKLSTPEGTFGNFFKIDGDKVRVIAEFENISEKCEKVTATFTSKNAVGVDSYSESFELTLEKGEKCEKVLEFVPEFSVFEGCMKLSSDTIYSTGTIKYAYISGTMKKNEKLGFTSHSLRLPTRKVEILAPWIRRMGASTVREGLWQDYSYGDDNGLTGPFELSDYQKNVIDTYHKNDIDWFQIVIWESRTFPQAFNNTEGFEKFSDPSCDEVLLQYLRDSAPFMKENAVGFQFLNEFNMHGYPADWYSDFLKRAFKVFRETTPDHYIVAGATSYIDFDWLDEMIKLSDNCYDSISVHPYTFRTGVDEIFEYTYYGLMKKFRDFLNERGQEKTPITITEIGFPTQKRFVHPEESHTKLEQAAYLTSLYNIYQTDYLNIDRIFFYDFQCDGPNLNELEDNLGIFETWDTVEYPYLARPAAVALPFMNEILTDSTFTKRFEDDKVHLYQYKSANGEDIVCLWARNCEYEASIKISGDAKIYDMFGNEISEQNGEFSLDLDYMPKYIIGKFDNFDIK